MLQSARVVSLLPSRTFVFAFIALLGVGLLVFAGFPPAVAQEMSAAHEGSDPLQPLEEATGDWPRPPHRLLAAAEGCWEGTLAYKDYQDPERRVKLDMMLTVAFSGPDAAVLHAVYDDGTTADGGRKIVHSYETWQLDWANAGFSIQSGDESRRFEIHGRHLSETGARLTLHRTESREGGQLFHERLALDLSQTRLSVTKLEATTPQGALADDIDDAMEWRNEYRLERAACATGVKL